MNPTAALPDRGPVAPLGRVLRSDDRATGGAPDFAAAFARHRDSAPSSGRRGDPQQFDDAGADRLHRRDARITTRDRPDPDRDARPRRTTAATRSDPHAAAHDAGVRETTPREDAGRDRAAADGSDPDRPERDTRAQDRAATARAGDGTLAVSHPVDGSHGATGHRTGVTAESATPGTPAGTPESAAPGTPAGTSMAPDRAVATQFGVVAATDVALHAPVTDGVENAAEVTVAGSPVTAEPATAATTPAVGTGVPTGTGPGSADDLSKTELHTVPSAVDTPTQDGERPPDAGAATPAIRNEVASAPSDDAGADQLLPDPAADAVVSTVEEGGPVADDPGVETAADPARSAPPTPTSGTRTVARTAVAATDAAGTPSAMSLQRAADHTEAVDLLARAELRRVLGGGELEADIDLGDLGRVRVAALEGRDGLELRLRSDQSARAALVGHLEELRTELREQGHDVARVHVDVFDEHDLHHGDRQEGGATSDDRGLVPTPGPTSAQPATEAAVPNASTVDRVPVTDTTGLDVRL